MKKTTLLLACIVGLAFFLRIYKVTQIPPALSWDEVSIGYNAYSILKTGRDEHGRYMPVDAFVAYGDYKPVLPVYLTVPFIALFGLNELAVRLPSALAGTLTVLLTYFLVLELFGKLRAIALLSSLLLAVSPWHMQLSRAGFEANIALMFVVLGVWLVLKARSHPKLFVIAWLPFVASMYTFNSARYFVPLLGLALLVFCSKEINKHIKSFFGGVVVAIIFLLPILPYLLSPAARLRFAEVNIFTDFSIVKTANDRMTVDGNIWWSKILHNRRLGYARSYLLHLFDNVEPWFLFIRGDGNPKFSLQDVGQLYVVEIPFLVLGVYWLLVKERRAAWLLLAWVIGAMLPAAVARETPHALRIENSLPVWQIFVAAGIAATISKIKIQKSKIYFIAGLIGLLYAANFTYYWHNYFNHYANEFSGEWQWGYREAIRDIAPMKDQYEKIILTENLGRPHTYIAFYERIHPEEYRRIIDGSFDSAGFYNPYGLGKYRFTRQGVGEMEARTLYVLEPLYVPAGARIIKTIQLLNGNPVLVIFDKP
ncbi:MAG: hypothetical protein UY16_C0001G0020 [Candidatus Gottesmanbacteria bacterium GW2011_GWA2_47_9]|uniref:Glycosyltransferase RgtA/B/C/D-like domain-containing protein n=1 Tax=Candidatus Gottesmanbacteria bacterium GW2011_GWA2_47_9 TaxID=1618445 RepID=A0A0G1U469_9BACT|nr:MAG: hypothetical protein UY16_C0001G0020 [Candidatus Gottesmanbacteria bacterium GW2011_GWA2_47_9]